MNENRKNADSFASWYMTNRQYLINVQRRYYNYDEDLLSAVFISIYSRILSDGISIKDYKPYMLKALRYKYLQAKKKACRLVLVESYEQLQNTYCYEI